MKRVSSADRPGRGGAGPAVAVMAVGLFALCLWIGYYRSSFSGIFINDAWDYAGIARNAALGRGLLSQYLTPLGLAHRGVPQPDLWRAPLWPLLLSLFQRLFGFTDRASALAGGCCYTASACLVFLLGRRWFNLPVALAATLIFCFSSKVLEYSISGLTEPLAILLMLVFAAVLTAAGKEGLRRKGGGREAGSPWCWPLPAGLALGLFYLARYNAILFIPPALAYLCLVRCGDTRRQTALPPGPAAAAAGREVTFRRSGKGGSGRGLLGLAALFLAGFLLITSPWLCRNARVGGSPFFSLQKYEPVMFTTTYPGYSLYMRPVKVRVVRFILERPAEMAQKVAAAMRDYRRDLFNKSFNGVGLRVFLFSLLALLLPLDRCFPAQRGVRPLLASCYLLQLAALLPLHYIPRLFMIFAPFYAIYAAGAVWFLGAWLANLLALGDADREGSAGRARPGRWFHLLPLLLLAVFTWLGVRGNYPAYAPLLQETHPAAAWARPIREIARLVPENRVVYSDQGQLLAWYGGNTACKLPYSPSLLPEMNRLAPAGAIFLSRAIAWDLPEADPSWRRIYRTRPGRLYGYRLYRVYPDGSLLYLPDRS